jgi:hypothetical protein
MAQKEKRMIPVGDSDYKTIIEDDMSIQSENLRFLIPLRKVKTSDF